MSATGPGGTSTGTVTITVIAPTDPPAVAFYASPEIVVAGGSATLSWNVVNATTVSIDNGIGDVGVNGSVSVFPTATTDYTLTAIGAGGTTTATATVHVSAIGITITSPMSGAVINRPDVMVTGTFTNPNGNETGIVVNGVLAAVYGNEFTANHVPLQEGENTFTVTATDTSGDTNSASLTVTAEEPEHYVRIISISESGVTPLETTLRVEGSFSFTADQPTYTGPGTVEFMATEEENEFDIRIPVAGVYSFTTEVVKEGVHYTDTVIVNVMDQTQLDVLLQNKWNEMKDALAGGNIETALNYHKESSQEKYRAIYTALGADLAGLVQGMQEISPIVFNDFQAKYRIRQQDIGVAS